MTNRENKIINSKEKDKESYSELKAQVNQIVTFLQNQFGDNFQSKIENRMNELSNQIKFLQTHLFPDFKEDQNESFNYKKFCNFVQKCQRSHDDLSQEESEIAEIYNELLDFPVILNQIDITRHHRILSQALELNKSNFNYEKFIEFIFESIKNERYEAQSLLIYFDETDFSSFSTKIDEMKQQGGFDNNFLSYRNDRYLNLFDQRFSEEQRNTELKTQIEEILTIVHRNENENLYIFEEIKKELQQQNHELEERILNELKTENSTLKSQLERMENNNEEMKNKIDELIQRQQEHQTVIEEMKKLNCNLLTEFEKHFNHLEQMIQIEHNTTKESLKNELKTSLSKLQELSKLNEVQQNQTKILNLIQQIDNFFYHKCSFVSESKFDGILNYLHHKGQVQLTSGHEECNNSCKVTNLIDYSNTSDTYYAANADQQTNWIEFNFLTRQIDLSSYQIKSYGNYHNPKTWEIRGSNDQNHWDTLDRRENCSDLNGNNITKHFTCKTPTHKHYRYIRFYQYDSWVSDHPFVLRLSRFELYGDIYKT